ncbi:MAG: hypothetical protein KIS85_04490, partial [Anaerolineales bacterium]|nr:hypothetical protein [Anaerolineales bacterium]
ELSWGGAGPREALAVQARSQSAALRWALRRHPQASGGQAAPALALAPATQDPPAEFAAYRGQSFALQAEPAWEGWPPNLFAWLIFRQAPIASEHIILWARSDLFLDGAGLDNFQEAIP